MGGPIDLIDDFNVADDTIGLDDAIFSTLALGQLAANAFAVEDFGAADRDDRIIYEPYTGRLYTTMMELALAVRCSSQTSAPDLR